MPILRPTIGDAPNWTSPENAIDGNENTSATIKVHSFNRTLTLNFNFSSITGTISSMKLYVVARGGKDTIKMRLYINGDNTKKVMEQTPIVNDDINSVPPRSDFADISDHIGSVSTITLKANNANPSGNTLEIFEIYIEYELKKYTVRFLDWNGNVLESQSVVSGSSATPPPNPSRDGYVFDRWDKSYTNINSDTDITAIYKKLYTVRFLDWNGNVLKSQSVAEGNSAIPPSNPSRNGYIFKGWNGTYTNISSDADITAIYKKLYTVRFLDWDGNELKSESVEEGNSATPPSDPSRNGYVFKGWNGTYTNISSNVDITAIYKKLYTVQFLNWNGDVLKSENVEEGKSATAPSDPSRTGYTFTGWNPSNFSNITSDLTVTAQYTIKEYTVIFVDHNGTALKTQTVAHGSGATAPSDPIREGYTFTGWNPSNFSNITGDLTVTAQYAINTYTVIFKDYDGTILKEEQIVEYGSNAIPPNNPSREGYTFTGWDKVFSNVTSNLVITATYVENTASINKILIGDTTTDNLYVGDSNVVAVYIGDFLVFGIDISE